MSITTIAEAIKTIGAGLSVIETAFDPPPDGPPSAGQLPALWTFTGGAVEDWGSLGTELGRETRIFRVQVAVVVHGEVSPSEREARCRPVLEAMRDALAGRPRLSGLSVGVERTLVLGDSGIVVLPEFGGAFVGFELRLQVTEVIKRIYAGGD